MFNNSENQYNKIVDNIIKEYFWLKKEKEKFERDSDIQFTLDFVLRKLKDVLPVCEWDKLGE